MKKWKRRNRMNAEELFGDANCYRFNEFNQELIMYQVRNKDCVILFDLVSKEQTYANYTDEALIIVMKDKTIQKAITQLKKQLRWV